MCPSDMEMRCAYIAQYPESAPTHESIVVGRVLSKPWQTAMSGLFTARVVDGAAVVTGAYGGE